MELALEIVQLEQLVKETDSTLSTLILASIAELVLELAQQEQSAKLNLHYFNKAEKEDWIQSNLLFFLYGIFLSKSFIQVLYFKKNLFLFFFIFFLLGSNVAAASNLACCRFRMVSSNFLNLCSSCSSCTRN